MARSWARFAPARFGRGATYLVRGEVPGQTDAGRVLDDVGRLLWHAGRRGDVALQVEAVWAASGRDAARLDAFTPADYECRWGPRLGRIPDEVAPFTTDPPQV